MSNGGRLMVWNIVRNGFLWSTILFEKEVIFHDFDFETSALELEVLKSNSWKNTLKCFSKTMSLQREPFLTMFYTINLSPLLITKKGLELIIILGNYQ